MGFEDELFIVIPTIHLHVSEFYALSYLMRRTILA